jgi:hypothetical protein
MTKPMTDERLNEFETWGGPNEQDLVAEIRRLREENEQVKVENAGVWKLINSRADNNLNGVEATLRQNAKLRKVVEEARRVYADLQLTGNVYQPTALYEALRELDEGEK